MPYCANLVGIWPSQVLIDTFIQFGRATPRTINSAGKTYMFTFHIDVRFVRQIIDGPDRVRGVKEICLYSKNWPGSVMGTGLIVLEKWEFIEESLSP